MTGNEDDDCETLECLPHLVAEGEKLGVELDPDIFQMLAAAPIGSPQDLDLWQRSARVLRERDPQTYSMLRAWAVATAATITPMVD